MIKTFPTLTPIPSIFALGKIQHAPVADDFISALRKQAGIEVVAVYYSETPMQNCLHVLYHVGDPQNAPDEHDEHHLTDCPRAEEIFALYFDACDRHGVEYHSVPAREKPPLPPPAKPSLWKQLFGKPQIPVPDYIPAHVVTLEPFEPLALWHLFALYREKVEKNLAEIHGLSLRVYGQWDDDQGFPVLRVFAHTDMQYAELMARPDLNEITETCRLVMRHYDAFGIMDTAWFQVEFGSWERLPDEVRFGMVRG